MLLAVAGERRPLHSLTSVDATVWQGLAAVVFLALPVFYSLLVLCRLEGSAAVDGEAAGRPGSVAEAALPVPVLLAGVCWN